MSPPNAIGAAQVRALISGASEMTPRDTWPDPDMRLIDDDRAPAPIIDDDALPAGWEPWIAVEAAARACPRDYVAAGLIGVASAWVGNARRTAATADWTEPAHLWFALVGAPSTGKTPALRPMIEASRELERDAEPAWREARQTYERDAEAADAADKAWRQAVREARKNGAATPDRPRNAEAPSVPPRPRVIAMDTSTEELQHMLADAPRGLLYTRDELAGWLGGFDRYGGKGADRAFYLEAWNGGAYVCDRVKFEGEPVRIEHTSLAIVGGIVPDRLRNALKDADDGLVERLLFVWPEPAPIVPLWDCGATDAAGRRKMLHWAARRLRALEMGSDVHGAPAPRALSLDPDARKLFDEARQQAMWRARAASDLAAGWHGKNPGRILRLALVFEHLAWAARDDGAASPASVSADAVVRAAGYIDYAAAMLERVTAGLAIRDAHANAAKIARHLLALSAPVQSQQKTLNERELYQTRGFAWAREEKLRTEAFAVLRDDGWLRPEHVDGQGRPRGDWQINPRIWEARL